MKTSLPKLLMAAPFAHRTALLFLGMLSFAVHFLYLDHPNQVIFDEFHFGKFVNAYCCSRERFFDIHPPHAKLMMALFATIGGYKGNLGFGSIGESLAAGPVVALRMWPAITGSLIPVLGYLLLRRWRVPVGWAFAGGFALALDNAILVQTRIMALDGQLLFGSILALWLTEVLLNARTTARRLWLSGAVGGAVAIAVGAKFTGLAVIPVLAARMAWHFFDSGMKPIDFWQPAAGFASGLTAFFSVYLAGWVAHFRLLQRPGGGDSFYQLTGNFFKDVFQLHRIMVSANNGITATHPWTSPWWGWPLMKKPVYYWVYEEAVIYFAGNPAVWWLVQAMGLLLLIRFVGSAVMDRSRHDSLSIGIVIVLTLALVASYLPYAMVSRGLFLYHYLPTLMWATLLSSFLMSRLFSRQSDFKPWHLVALVATGFLATTPVTYGFELLRNVPTWLLNLS